MKRRISQISPVRTSLVMAVLYFFITLPIVVLMAVPMFFVRSEMPGFPIALMVALPFIYAFFGFLFTVYGCWVYNFVARFTGGFEYTSDESGEA